jgi:hypothetical protein
VATIDLDQLGLERVLIEVSGQSKSTIKINEAPNQQASRVQQHMCSWQQTGERNNPTGKQPQNAEQANSNSRNPRTNLNSTPPLLCSLGHAAIERARRSEIRRCAERKENEMFISKRRAVVACAAMSLLATGSEAVCPDTSGVGETYDLHILHFNALVRASRSPMSYDYLQQTNPGNLCVKDDVSNIPELYKDCNKLFGAVFEEFFLNLECDKITADKDLCATPYSQVVENLCNVCPKSETEIQNVLSLLLRCGYLASLGGAQLDNPEAATACLAEQGACQQESSNSLFMYSKCRLPMKQLIFDWFKSIGAQSIMATPDDCYSRLHLNKLLPQERCDEEFGFLVSELYCAVQESFLEQKVGETTMGTVLLAGSFGGIGALGAIFLRYRRPQTASVPELPLVL